MFPLTAKFVTAKPIGYVQTILNKFIISLIISFVAGANFAKRDRNREFFKFNQVTKVLAMNLLNCVEECSR